MDNSKAEQFLRDIGLNMKLEELEPVKPTHNLLAFISLKSGKMDSAMDAIETHVRNLIVTYGEEAVKQAFSNVLGVKNEQAK